MRNLSVVEYEQPGFDPDTRILGFTVEFHVHSTVLRLHSEFFRAFLKHYGQQHATPGSSSTASPFLYEYTLVRDDDDMFGLQPLAKSKPISEDDDRTNQMKHEAQDNIRQLLDAFYIKSSDITYISELEQLVRTADFYGALPITSRYVESNLQNCQLGIYIADNPVLVLCLARKLEAPVLFREAFTLVVGSAYDTECRKEINAKLRSTDLPYGDNRGNNNADLIPLINHYCTRLYRDVADVNFFLLKASRDHEHVLRSRSATPEEQREALILDVIQQELHPANGYGDLDKWDATFYRKLYDAPFTPSTRQALMFGDITQQSDARVSKLSRLLQAEVAAYVKQKLKHVTKSYLKFTRPFQLAGGESPLKHFLCVRVSYRDLPWIEDSDDGIVE
ncbi:hypothetical protein FQN50_006209 [Emmonsiellopsis sp. PD_5]|nr:hypothetical protein FQN50_006209 [Emmonsiellopsis sp. PD_5]